MLSIEDYYNEFMQEVYAKAGAESDFYKSVFTDLMCGYLESQDIITDGFQNIGFKKETKGIYADAWSYNENFERLDLIISDYKDDAEVCSIANSDVDRNFKRVERFYTNSLSTAFYQSLEESNDAFEIALNICSTEIFPISSIRFILLTNAVLSERVKGIPNKKINNITCSYDIWDISRLHRIEISGQEKENIEIEVSDFSDEPIPCLPAFTGSAECESFLVVLPGSLLAMLYERYGERLLEQNVRTFLQFKTKINRGLRSTIVNEPEMFFAYNNGLTATAEAVVRDSNNSITKINNLQIVNGGQTTASIYTTYKNNKDIDISKVFVQMKLSVISSGSVSDVVPRISEYANTQNKVNAADFFSNHPYHLRIEELSRRLWAPSPEGDVRETHWFYERARGQYANKQAMLTESDKKKFVSQNPKLQMFTKTDLAKYENSFAKMPYVVSKGAQSNFAKFASDIGEQWDKASEVYNEHYFKRLVAKAMVFKYLDGVIMKQDWYGGYKANIVTYTISKLIYEIEALNKVLDYGWIWQNQKLTESLEVQLLGLAKVINDLIKDTPHESTNVTQWCKQPKCWDKVRESSYSFMEGFEAELIDASVEQEQVSEAVKEQKIEDSVNEQTLVFDKGADYWCVLHAWLVEEEVKIFTPKEMNILSIAKQIPVKFPTDKQAKILLDAEKKAIKEGFYFADNAN